MLFLEGAPTEHQDFFYDQLVAVLSGYGAYLIVAVLLVMLFYFLRKGSNKTNS